MAPKMNYADLEQAQLKKQPTSPYALAKPGLGGGMKQPLGAPPSKGAPTGFKPPTPWQQRLGSAPMQPGMRPPQAPQGSGAGWTGGGGPTSAAGTGGRFYQPGGTGWYSSTRVAPPDPSQK